MVHKPVLRLSVLAALLATGCVSYTRRIPAPTVYVSQVRPRPQQTVFFDGPVPVDCEVWISNVADIPVALSAIEIHTVGKRAFALDTRTMPIATTIPAGGTITFSVSTWGSSRGGDFADRRRVSLTGTAWFTAGRSRPQPVSFTNVF